MAEETSQKTETTATNTERTYTEVEQQALSMGWRPKEEFDGDPTQWRSAELYVALDPFYKKIEAQNRENKQLKEAVREVKTLFSKVKEAEYKRAIEELKAEKVRAYNDGDVNRIVSIDEDIEKVKIEQAQMVAQVNREPVVQEPPALVQWKEKNSWYQKDEDLTAWADGRAQRLVQNGISPGEVLEKLHEEVRKKFPDKFHNPRRDQPSAVEAPVKGGKTNERLELTDQERTVMNTLVRQGVMTEKEYIEQLKKVR